MKKKSVSENASTRRQFLADSLKLAALFGVPVNLKSAFGAESTDSMVFVFLRGGADGLSMVRPANNTALKASYDVLAAARPDLMIQNARRLGNSNFDIHPELARVKALYESGDLAIVHGAGSPNPTRSHFEQQDLIEYGNPNRLAGSYSGFLNRSLAEISDKSTKLPAVSIGTKVNLSLRGQQLAVSLPVSLAGYPNLTAPGIVSGLALESRLAKGMQSVPEEKTRIDSLSHSRGYQAGNALETVKEAIKKRGDLNLGTGEQYGNISAFPTAVQLLATDPGLKMLTIDIGGWDTHFNMGPNEGAFNNLMIRIDKALGQMAADLKANGLWNRTTVVVMSEFGRRVAQNGSGGLDHGRGGVLFTMGGQVNGKKVVTQVPGGAAWDLRQLEAPGDVRVTVDYRHVFHELFRRRFQVAANKMTDIFPGFTGVGLGLFKG